MTNTSRYIMIGGFLGAGKTTAVLKLAEHLRRQGKSVGLITNDQSVGLVDTAMLSAHGFPVREITGGCFCCRFNSLIDAADTLTRDARPDVFIAEPVGSCTDLKASVSYPLRRMYGEQYSIAPLSVLVDPIRAARILGLEPGKAFSRKVAYVYSKQLEEAEVIVVNKIDLLDDEKRAALRGALRSAFLASRVMEASAREGTGLEQWFDAIASADLGSAAAMEMDYDLYAEGEALLGWMNCTVSMTSSGGAVDGNVLLQSLAGAIRERLEGSGTEIAHLKMTLAPRAAAGMGGDLAVLNLVRSDGSLEMSHSLQGDVSSGEMIVNLRAEADPDSLKAAVLEAMHDCEAKRPGVALKVDHLEHFRPGRPQPTHRLAEA